jgi:hypothetical protein
MLRNLEVFDLQKYIPMPSPWSGIAATTAAMSNWDDAINTDTKLVE